jgi:hypothetical protein
MLISRRGLIAGLGSLLAAPAIVRATSIMPVKLFDPAPAGAFYWREWKACTDGLLAGPSIGPLVLTPWQAENLAKPSGYVEGRDYIIQRELPLQASSDASSAMRLR